MMLWGSLTAAYGGVVAAKQTDLKKILAYSTISHCGYMMVLVGCGDTNSLVFYFYIHGMFKALLFLLTGNIMRFYATQDLRKMGNV
jgi:NADH-quinone oxidoreductase subunit L